MESIKKIEPNDLVFLNDLKQEYDINYYNIRMANGHSTSFSILNGVSKLSMTGSNRGFSIQTFSDGGWGLASGKEFDKKNIEDVFVESAKLAKFSSKYTNEIYSIPETPIELKEVIIKQEKPFDEIGPDEKIKFLLNMENNAKIDDRIKTVRIGYSDGNSEYLSYNGARLIKQNKSACFIFLEVVARDGTNLQRFHKTNGGLGGFEIVEKQLDMAEITSKNALELLESTPVKGGTYNIIMDPSLTGTFIHEAFGHACEADAVLAGESLLADRVEQHVGGDNINIYDDGTMNEYFGYCPYDNEGTKGQKTVLVKKGVLKGYLHNLETASKMNLTPTGNARSSSYGSRPIVRMTNTYLDHGDSTLDEMLEEMKNGILCIGWNYGYTEPSDGSFMFKMAKGYMVEDGKKTKVVRDAAISGSTLDVLQRINLLGKRLELDPGHCGKDGQTAPVGSGGPYTFIKNMTMGGQ